MGGRAILMGLAAALLVAAPGWAGETVRVGMERMQFVPKLVKVKPGTTVEWVNDEKRTSHSVLFEKEGLAESDRLFPGESWKRTFDKPGLYPYVCGPHREMTGVVEVVP
ncbi:plastocyanin [Paramagnetospirillum marisnigri]|uniref:Plastocyanin n=1 Tax=Paramagnetospirillum marisnigri TaxID=1285242 RepID=A0A178MSN4_9PROT|nr:plastocyanin/azurin family copper-binding protein [Paramagnetospirillum marisnigri]OAN51088.1 plastocyanin [Paramagnetospirillum marisnigri]